MRGFKMKSINRPALAICLDEVYKKFLQTVFTFFLSPYVYG